MPQDERLHFATPHRRDGRALRYHFDEFVLAWLAELARDAAQDPAYAVATRYIEPPVLSLYVEQALYVELLDVAREIFRAKYRAEKGLTSPPVVVPRGFVNLICRSLPAGCGVVPARARTLQSRVKEIRRALKSWIPSRGSFATQSLSGCIAVELVEGIDPNRKCDAFWLAGGEIDPRQVVFVIEPGNRAFVDLTEVRMQAKALGCRLVSIDPFMTDGSRIPFWKPAKLPEWSIAMRTELRATDSAFPWLASSLARLAAQVGFWETFYRDYEIQVVQQFTELSTDTAVKRIAADKVGGIEIGKMRSQFFETASAAFHFQHEYAFVWHRNVAPILFAGRTRTNAVIETGYVYDYLIRHCEAEAKDIRGRLTGGAALQVIAVFDNAPHLNGHFSTEQLALFYQVIVDLVQRRRDVALIVKSKKPEVLTQLAATARILEALEADGRCIILDQPLTSVLPAALAADLAVGFPASTAACEAALVGCRTLMFDPARAGGHPWVRARYGIIYSDIENFRLALDAAVDVPSRVGMQLDQLQDLDPFRDGRAPTRAATFIAAFLDARKAGYDKRASVDTAIRSCQAFAMCVAESPPDQHAPSAV